MKSSLDQEIKLAIIGCGRAAERIYLPVISKFSNIKVTAVVDPVEERRNFLSAKFPGCISLGSINTELINQIDGAIIATPPDTHICLALEFLKRNKYVLIEKPLAVSMEGIEELKQVESSSKASLMMGFNHRYWTPVSLLKEKLLGENKIDFTEFIFTSDYNKWNPVSFRSDPLDDLGPHLFDLIRFIFNKEILSISSFQESQNDFKLKVRIGGNQYINCCLAHCDQTIRSIKVNCNRGNYFTTLKSKKISPQPGLMRNFIDVKDRLMNKFLGIFPFSKSYEVQVKRFIDLIVSGESEGPGIQDGISALQAVEAARLSVQNNMREIFLNGIK